jgi:hypothetical protein
MREPGAAARVVAAREHVLEVAQGEAFVLSVGPPDRVHHPVAVGEHEAALLPDGPLDRGDRRPWVVGAGDEPLELERDAGARLLGEEAAAPVEVDRGGRGLTAVPREEDNDRQHGHAPERCGKK